MLNSDVQANGLILIPVLYQFIFKAKGKKKWKYEYTVKKKKKLSQLKSLRQPALADFWVLKVLVVLSLYNKKLRISYKNNLRELKNLLKLVTLKCKVGSIFVFYSQGCKLVRVNKVTN